MPLTVSKAAVAAEYEVAGTCDLTATAGFDCNSSSHYSGRTSQQGQGNDAAVQVASIPELVELILAEIGPVDLLVRVQLTCKAFKHHIDSSPAVGCQLGSATRMASTPRLMACILAHMSPKGLLFRAPFTCKAFKHYIDTSYAARRKLFRENTSPDEFTWFRIPLRGFRMRPDVSYNVDYPEKTHYRFVVGNGLETLEVLERCTWIHDIALCQPPIVLEWVGVYMTLRNCFGAAHEVTLPHPTVFDIGTALSLIKAARAKPESPDVPFDEELWVFMACQVVDQADGNNTTRGGEMPPERRERDTDGGRPTFLRQCVRFMQLHCFQCP